MDLRRRLLEVRLSPAPPRMTYEEFLDWAGEDTLAEWVLHDKLEATYGFRSEARIEAEVRYMFQRLLEPENRARIEAHGEAQTEKKLRQLLEKAFEKDGKNE